MTRLLTLSLMGLLAYPAAAQEGMAIGTSIAEQEGRVKIAYDRYLDDCFLLSEEDMQRVLREVDGILPECQSAIFDFELQTNVLVRLIHGDPDIICSGENCPELTD